MWRDGSWATQYLRSFGATIPGGTSEVQRNIIAERVLGLPARRPKFGPTPATVTPMEPRVGIVVVAYNAASTLAKVLDRIPPAFVPRISDVLVCDDASDDSTFLVGLGYQQTSELPLTIIRQERNLGYGGNQKAAYRWAIEHGLDIVVLLHGDGQYAPEELPNIVAPIVDGECDAVLGSRMMEKGAARRGGMPLYKFVGNRILTTFQNAVMGTDLTEWHSGYRAYRVAALREIPFEQNHDGFDFDTQIIIQLVEAGKRIVEIPIPTYYGDEICYVNGIGYARDVVSDVVRYRMHKIGFGSGDTAFASRDYEVKEGELSSHEQILAWVAPRPAGPHPRSRLCGRSARRGAPQARPSRHRCRRAKRPTVCAIASTRSCSPISTKASATWSTGSTT